MAQTHKKTGTCSATVAQVKYPMYLVVGESNDAPLCFSPALWLDASDADSITIVSDKVSQWADKSGNARHAVQATADSQPVVGSAVIDGKNTIRFDGSDDYLTVSSFPTGASAYSMYAVLKIDNDPPAGEQSGFLTFDGDSSLVSHYPYPEGTVYSDFATTARKTVGNPSPSLASAHLLNFDSAASLWTCRINGTQIYTTGTNTVGMSSATNDIGKSGNYFDGDFAEILIFPSVLSVENRLIVEGYLAHKWGLESSLPTGHPYKTNAPVTVSCDGHCKSDFGDIRFHDSTDAALNYMIDWGSLQGTTPNQSVGVWVAPSPGTYDTDVVLKYGDSALTDASDWAAVFIKYKPFETGNDGDSIATADADWTVHSGTCEIDTAQKYSGTRSLKLVGGATAANTTIAHTAGTGYAIRVRMRKTTGAGTSHPFLHGNGTKRLNVYCDTSENIVYQSESDGTTVATGYNCGVDTWDSYEACNIDFTAGTFDLWFNGALIAENAVIPDTATNQDQIRFHNSATTAGNDAWIDDLIVRKYASPEPTWGTWGAEEEISSGSNADISCGIASLVISAVADFDIVAPIDISCGVAALGISASADFSIVAPGPVTATLSQAFREAVAKKEIDFLNDTFRIILMGADFEYDPETHGTLADVTSEQLPTGYGYTQDSKTLTGVAGEFNYDGYYSVTWDDASWTANGWPIGPTSAAIIYDYTHADQVVAYALQFGENRTVHNGFNLKIMGLEVIL